MENQELKPEQPAQEVAQEGTQPAETKKVVSIFDGKGNELPVGKEGSRRKLLQHGPKGFLTDNDKQLIEQGNKLAGKAVEGAASSIKITDDRRRDTLLERALDESEKIVKQFNEEVDKDAKNGFNINDVDSVNSFETDFTPMENEVLVKFIIEEYKIGSIFVPTGSDLNAKKAIIVETGLHVSYLQKGDIVVLRGGKIQATNFMIKGIKFNIIDAGVILGVFSKKQDILSRLK